MYRISLRSARAYGMGAADGLELIVGDEDGTDVGDIDGDDDGNEVGDIVGCVDIDGYAVGRSVGDGESVGAHVPFLHNPANDAN